MEYVKTFNDERLDGMCSYCGDYPDTRDHVPSKILLDDPFPENLPVIPCCNKCNQSFSLDEEYFACAIECVLHGTAEIGSLQRDKIKSILTRKELLRNRIEKSFVTVNGHLMLQMEEDRLKNVITKLAKGHAKYENSEPVLEVPSNISIKLLESMSLEENEEFFNEPSSPKTPELGSRSFMNMVLNANQERLSPWTVVQDNNYAYLVHADFGDITVKILVRNYLAIEVKWFN